jgi:hypothetical protein
MPEHTSHEAERVDALAAKTLPGSAACRRLVLRVGRVRWHVKFMFIRGTEIKPEPPVTPIGMGKATRGVEPRSVDDLDERQAASWMRQAAVMPFIGGKKR